MSYKKQQASIDSLLTLHSIKTSHERAVRGEKAWTLLKIDAQVFKDPKNDPNYRRVDSPGGNKV